MRPRIGCSSSGPPCSEIGEQLPPSPDGQSCKPLREAALSLLVFSVLFLGCLPAFGQKDQGLGKAHMAISYVPYLGLFDSVLDTFRVDHDAYVGVSYYHRVGRVFYLGGELGYSGPSGFRVLRDSTGERVGITSSLNLVPVEFNVKYVIDEWRRFVGTFGVGVSGVRVRLGQDPPESELTIVAKEDREWLLGGQLFAGAYYLFDRAYFGMFIKMQVTHDRIFPRVGERNFEQEDYSNGQAGFVLGWRFF